MALKLILVLAAFALVGLLLFRGSGDTTGIDARRLVGEGAAIVDVRTTEEFASGHIDGAVNIPVVELRHRMGEIGPKDVPVVVYCRSGNRSATAARTLKEGGFKSVHDLGPMSAWTR